MATPHKTRQQIPVIQDVTSSPPIVTAQFIAADAQLGAIQLRALAHGAPAGARELLIRLAEGLERAGREP